MIDGALLAIDEINQKGGVLGRPIEPVIGDGMSDSATFVREAERLITKEGVVTIFGCWTSAHRKAVRPMVEKHDHLLIYPVQYEGLEQSPNIVYTGATPNQQILPAIKWSYTDLGAPLLPGRLRLRLPACCQRHHPRPGRSPRRRDRRRTVPASGSSDVDAVIRAISDSRARP